MPPLVNPLESVDIVRALIDAFAKLLLTLEILPTLIFTSPALLIIDPLFVKFAVGELIVKLPFEKIVEPVVSELFPKLVEFILDVMLARDEALLKSSTVALVPSRLFLVARLK